MARHGAATPRWNSRGSASDGSTAGRPLLARARRLSRQGDLRPFHGGWLPPGDGFGRRRPGGRGGPLGHGRRLADPEVRGPPRPPLRRRALARRQDAGHLRLRQGRSGSGTSATGNSCTTLAGHNGAVYDVAFSPDGRFLVSASADDTCKVWRVRGRPAAWIRSPSPSRRNTAAPSAPTAAPSSPAGADNMIRVWEFVSRDKPRDQPDGPGAIRPRRARSSGWRSPRTARGSSHGRGPDRQGLGDRRLHRASAVGAAARRGDGAGRSRATARRSAWAGWTARWRVITPRRAPARRRGDRRPEARPRRLPRCATRATRAVARSASPTTPPPQANDVERPGGDRRRPIAGRSGRRGDADLYRFSARAGEPWVIEVDAARSGSKLDSFVEVLDARGRRIERVLLQAVRDSYFTFRGKDDSTGQRLPPLQLGGDAAQRVPLRQRRGRQALALPPGARLGLRGLSRRRGRGGATSTRPRWPHALGEPCYVVQPHPPGTELIPNGLPVFPLYFDNDDESHRELGKDSKLDFTAPADGQYLVKIKDVRGLEGPDLTYTLTIRPRSPRFPGHARRRRSRRSAPAGRQEFKVTAKRIDGFDGPIRVDIDGLPPGFSVDDTAGDRGRPDRGAGRDRGRGRRRRADARAGQGEPRSRRRPRSRAATCRTRSTPLGEIKLADEARAARADPTRRGRPQADRRCGGEAAGIRDPSRPDDHAEGQGPAERACRPGPPGERGLRPQPPVRRDRGQSRPERPADHRGPGRADLLRHGRPLGPAPDAPLPPHARPSREGSPAIP